MIEITPLTDRTSLIGGALAIRKRFEKDGYLFFRGVLDPDLVAWARGKYREALAAEDLIDLAVEAPIWTGSPPKTRRTCDALGTQVWHEIIKQPKLNAIMHDVFDGKPMWLPIVAHRSYLPTGPLTEGQDLFAGRHQDAFYNQGIEFALCWMPMMDIGLQSGTFAVLKGSHKRGNLHPLDVPLNSIDPADTPVGDWRASEYRVGDVLVFDRMTVHAGLPNPSDQIRMSLDIRVSPEWAPQPVIGEVQAVDGTDVTIRTEDGEDVTVHISDDTFIRDMDPYPRVPTSQLQRIAYPGAHVIAMAGTDLRASVLRRNFY